MEFAICEVKAFILFGELFGTFGELVCFPPAPHPVIAEQSGISNYHQKGRDSCGDERFLEQVVPVE
jgi:hypothetical protein